VNQAEATPLPQPVASPVTDQADPFFHPARLTYEPDFYSAEIQQFLDQQPGPLKSTSFAVGDRTHTLAESLTSQSTYFGFNPKIMLAMLEVQSGLLSNAKPSEDALNWAAGFRGEKGNWRGINAQTRWVTRQLLLARRDYLAYAPLTYADEKSLPAPAGLNLSQYVIARVFAPTTTPEQLPDLMNRFVATYTTYFGDPRTSPSDWPTASEPFLWYPLSQRFPVTSFFDHGGPFLARNARAGITTYWGRTETDLAFQYNGHDGWDYAAAPPELALAAADGLVIFAGNANDNCATRAVVLDHGNGYRTFYWHLARIDAQVGQPLRRGDAVGMVGNSGCSLGPHLHFGVQFLGRGTDPYGWCAADPDPWAEHPAGTPSRWLWADRPSPCGEPPDGTIVVDDGGPGFVQGGTGWGTVPTGYGGSASFVQSQPSGDDEPWELRSLAEPALAVYQVSLPQAGTYRVLAYVPYALNGLEDSAKVRYRIRHAAGEALVDVNARTYANDWADLGTYTFEPGGGQVTLTNLAEDGMRGIWADAILWIPVTQ
jgi:murein DD-endopeptidase MepM/ murein hydrolase activator NlpD